MRKLVLGVLSILLLKFCLSKVSAISCIEKEREALLQLKKSFDDPSHRLDSWNNNNGSTNCCNWDGVGCNKTTGHVTKIDLSDNSQVSSSLSSNSLDSSLFEFKYLNFLDLSGNDFNLSQIPKFLGSMLELRYLNLSRASFVGKVPPHLGNLTKLVVLDLSFNQLAQPNDDVEWISHLSSLHYLNLSWMDFSKASSNLMQMFASLPLLSSLILSSCSLQNIHLSLSSLNSSFLSRIQLLDLSSNNLNGPIPKVFQNMSSLMFLGLSDNQFTIIEGGLSTFIGNNCRLKIFDLSENHGYFGGDHHVFTSYENESMGCNRYDLQVLSLAYTSVNDKIPDWLGKFTNLQLLDLQNSSIYGPIPTSLGNLSSLEYLDLSYNALTGAIPGSLGRLLNLRELHLEGNRLEEVGDECFIQLGNLEVLDISRNLLKGILTEASFSSLSQLHTLSLGSNEHLLLDMKSNWVPPFQLKYLHGESCVGCFGSDFPQWLRTQHALLRLQLSNMNISSALPTWLIGQNLTLLDLSHNQIVGPLPTSIGIQMPNLKILFLSDNLINDSLPPISFKLNNLRHFDLSYNQIVGPLPTSIGDQMPNLEIFLLNDNFINDSLPLSLCNLKNLEFLDLSNNRLSGMVQGCLLTSNLIILDLSLNKFSGSFPYTQGNDLSRVEKLYLGNNNFVGSMPIVLKNSESLKILDLEGNKFSGNIPTWVGDNLKNLQFLRLRGNSFNGTIPSNLCNLTYLKILDLAYNQLEGSIPSNLNNFDVMTGKMRYGACNGCTLNADSLILREESKNVGQLIKSSNFNYSSLQLELMVNIDLSKNYLVGSIPSEITMLKALIGLNLSHNNLTGIIPTKIGGIESLESLDLSFNQLSGSIPRSISQLNSLGMVKLSHNNLSGDIPREGHFSTFNEASSFDGNPYLCGDPLPMKCAIENSFEPPSGMKNLDQEEDKWEKWLLHIMIILGYAIGFWAVVGTVILKGNWRYG